MFSAVQREETLQEPVFLKYTPEDNPQVSHGDMALLPLTLDSRLDQVDHYLIQKLSGKMIVARRKLPSMMYFARSVH